MPARHSRGLPAMRQRDGTASAETAPGAYRADRRRGLPRRQRRNRIEGIVFRLPGRRGRRSGFFKGGSNGARRREITAGFVLERGQEGPAVGGGFLRGVGAPAR